MLIKTAGIIFQTKKYSESSLIADIYTEEKGLRSYIISGVRSKKGKGKCGALTNHVFGEFGGISSR